jgi:hypothetical protein
VGLGDEEVDMGDLDTGAGKGPDARPGVHGKDWDDCPLWENMRKARKKREREEKKKNDKKQSS